MNTIYSIEENEECQFTFEELKSCLTNYVPNDKNIRARLQSHYKDKIIISSSWTYSTIVCLKKCEYNILSNAWYEQRKSNKDDEEYRLLDVAAEILLSDIQSQISDFEQYPVSDKMFDNIDQNVSPKLLYLLRKIILKNRKGNLRPYEVKCSSISHAVISAVRPWSFISPLLLGVSVTLHRKFGSKKMIDICLSLIHI